MISRQNASTQSVVLSPLPLPVNTSGVVTPNTLTAVHSTIHRTGPTALILGMLMLKGIRPRNICVTTT